jgi:hypothetical protein
MKVYKNKEGKIEVGFTNASIAFGEGNFSKIKNVKVQTHYENKTYKNENETIIISEPVGITVDYFCKCAKKDADLVCDLLKKRGAKLLSEKAQFVK